MILILRKESFFITAWKVPKYGVFSGLYFPAFSPNTGKYGPEKYPYLDTFHAVYGDKQFRDGFGSSSDRGSNKNN